MEHHEDSNEDKSLAGTSWNMLNWANVIEFLQEQHRELEIKETTWMIEKESMKQKIAMLEGKLKAYENHNDLIARIKMLEYALR